MWQLVPGQVTNLAAMSGYPELVDNGNPFTASGWAIGTGWAISGGLASAVAAGAFSVVSRSIALTAGVTYTAVISVSAVGAGGVRLAMSGGTQVSLTTRTTPGTYTQDFVANSGNNLFNVQAGASGFTGSVAYVSVRRK